MGRKKKPTSAKSSPLSEGITKISVGGFKSIFADQSIEIRPLTILAGVNSSGKSSIMQPLLLMKQTLEQPIDPGGLWLNGPNVTFTSAKQMLSRKHGATRRRQFHVSLEVGNHLRLETFFSANQAGGFEVSKMTFKSEIEDITLRPNMKQAEIRKVIPKYIKEVSRELTAITASKKRTTIEWKVIRNRCFLAFRPSIRTSKGPAYSSPYVFSPGGPIIGCIADTIHLPGHRGNPERSYPVASVGHNFPGTFGNYTASVIANWQERKDKRLMGVSVDLKKLGLTWKAETHPIQATRLELLVGRLPRSRAGGARDLINIADVGFGVSQTLPVVVALRAARKAQLVYLEQPEIHLHPRAQVAMAEVIADAVSRGVRVVVETHSALLILGIQSMVAETSLNGKRRTSTPKLTPDQVKLHWFARNEDGETEVTSRDLDASGAFGDWPEDFGEVSLDAESRYLDAVDAYAQKG